jgi:hypothetical protein
VFTEKRWRKQGWGSVSEAQAHGDEGVVPGVAEKEKKRQRSVDAEGEHIEDVEKEKGR